MSQRLKTSTSKFDVSKILKNHDLQSVYDILGYNPAGSFSITRDSRLLDKLDDNDAKALARDISCLTGAPIRLSAAWIMSKSKNYSPRNPRNPFLVPDVDHLKLFFKREEGGWRPRNIDEILKTVDEVKSVLLHDLRVRLQRLG